MFTTTIFPLRRSLGCLWPLRVPLSEFLRSIYVVVSHYQPLPLYTTSDGIMHSAIIWTVLTLGCIGAPQASGFVCFPENLLDTKHEDELHN